MMHIHDDPTDIEYRTAMRLQKREITEEQMQRFESYAAKIFSAFGTQHAYHRVARAICRGFVATI